MPLSLAPLTRPSNVVLPLVVMPLPDAPARKPGLVVLLTLQDRDHLGSSDSTVYSPVDYEWGLRGAGETIEGFPTEWAALGERRWPAVHAP
jgi:hypothetical protein